ncbi:MAG TPA: hypothetical protein VF443_04315 [Nitrospira sp.]
MQFVTRRSAFAIKEISGQLLAINSKHIERFSEIVGVVVEHPHFSTLEDEKKH